MVILSVYLKQKSIIALSTYSGVLKRQFKPYVNCGYIKTYVDKSVAEGLNILNYAICSVLVPKKGQKYE